MAATLTSFIDLVRDAIQGNAFIKLTLGNKRVKEAGLKNVFIKPVALKSGFKLSFLYRYPTNDITKNLDTGEAFSAIETMLQQDFYNADLFTSSGDHHLLQQPDGKVKLVNRPASLSTGSATLQHDKQKQRIIQATGKNYLHALGITTTEGAVKKDMQDKYKQINRYVEIVEGFVKDLQFGATMRVVDMGSGKGYLTFALYDYLTNKLRQQASITGIEMRPDLVRICNDIAVQSGYARLHFKEGTIADTALAETDLLIALHACDTATDDAIFKGIQANAQVIICAPCCHKQIRKQMKPDNVLQYVTKHGILLERQAEMLTDAIRAMLMEANGYKTKVFDFIGTEHTPKNVLIVGTKTNIPAERKVKLLEDVQALKAMFNVSTHYLETLLG